MSPAESEANCAHHRSAHDLARLVKRAIQIDRQHWPNCGGHLKIIAGIFESSPIK
jgi:hypothetical protein